MSFYIGQRVVFIGMGNFLSWPPEHIRPIYGHVYTVRWYGQDPLAPLWGLLVNEIKNPPVVLPRYGPVELRMDEREWRPAVDRKTDISVFQEMLTDNRVPI